MTCPCNRYEPDPGLCGIPSVPPCPEGWTHGAHCRCAHFPAQAAAPPPSRAEVLAVWVTLGLMAWGVVGLVAWGLWEIGRAIVRVLS